MTKGKKHVSKSGQASRGNFEEAVNFGSGSTVGADDGGVINIGGTHDAFGDAGSSLLEGMADVDVNNVSFPEQRLCCFQINLVHLEASHQKLFPNQIIPFRSFSLDR